MRWPAPALALALALLAAPLAPAQEPFTCATQHNTISYHVPALLAGPPALTHRHARPAAADNTIFSTAHMEERFFKLTTLRRLTLAMIDWPEGCPTWESVVARLREHLAGPGIALALRGESHAGVTWSILEQRRAKDGALVALSCYAPLAGNEILYVGLRIHADKVTPAQREACRAALHELLSHLRVRPVDPPR